MKLKRGVTTGGTEPQIYYAIGIAEMVYRYLFNKDLVVTSLTDSHADRPRSLHNQGLAVDLRTRDLTAVQVGTVTLELKRFLEPLGYDVVPEPDHIHIEFDPKTGEEWIV